MNLYLKYFFKLLFKKEMKMNEENKYHASLFKRKSK